MQADICRLTVASNEKIAPDTSGKPRRNQFIGYAIFEMRDDKQIPKCIQRAVSVWRQHNGFHRGHTADNLASALRLDNLPP